MCILFPSQTLSAYGLKAMSVGPHRRRGCNHLALANAESWPAVKTKLFSPHQYQCRLNMWYLINGLQWKHCLQA